MRRHIRIQHFKELDLDLVDFELQSGYKLYLNSILAGSKWV